MDKLFSSIFISQNGTVTLTEEKLNEYIDKKLEAQNKELVEKNKELEETVNTLNQKIENLENKLPHNEQPKLLTQITLPNTVWSSRGIGTYNAKTSSYTKQNTQDFNEYLSFDEQKGWKIKKSGMYIIFSSDTVFASANVAPDTLSTLLINGERHELARSSSRKEAYHQDSNNLTIYLKEGTILDFEYQIFGGAPLHNSSTFTIFAM